MGSSAAFSVSLAAALIQAIANPDELDRSLVSRWAFESEKLFHGKPSGIDNNICTFGGAILYQNGQIKERMNQVNFLPLLLVYTNVKRNTKLLVEKTSGRRQAVSTSSISFFC
jgi:mevalonate kinase